MNIGQMARNQQMMYQIVNRGDAALRSQMSSLNASGLFGKSEKADVGGLMQSMGMSGLQGRTAREMAQYQLRVQQASRKDTGNANAVSDAGAAQSFSVREQYTLISDEATEAMQALALEDAKRSAETGSASFDDTGRAKAIQEQLKNVDPSKRAAAFNTMNKVWSSEMDRLENYIKEKDSNWKGWGDKFDTSILNEYKPGVNVWV